MQSFLSLQNTLQSGPYQSSLHTAGVDIVDVNEVVVEGVEVVVGVVVVVVGMVVVVMTDSHRPPVKPGGQLQ